MNFLSAVRPLTRRAIPWTCRACQRSQTVPTQWNTFATKTNAPPKQKNKRRRRIAVVGGGLGISAAVIAVNEDAKHAYVAAERSGRVASTLFVNIRE
jgi:aarF domain-containing kinase